MKPTLWISMLILSVFGSGCIVQDGDSSVTIINDSDYALIEINITSSYSDNWGRNYLGSDALLPGESMTISFIDCGNYDMRIVDDTYVECEFFDYYLCWDDDVWTITNTMLDDCAFD